LDNGAQKETISLSLICFHAGTLIISLTTFRPVASFFNASDTLYLLSVILLIIRMLHEGCSPLRLFVRDNPFFKPLLIFLLGAILSLINSSDTGAALTVMGKYIFLFGLWLPAGIYLIDSPGRIKGMMIVMIAAAMVPLIPAICDYYFQTTITATVDRLLSMNLAFPEPHGGRFGSVMGHPNNFGFMLVVVFPIFLWSVFFAKAWLTKIQGLLLLCLLAAGSLVTASRSMALAMTIQFTFFMSFMPQRKLKQKTAYFVVVLLLIAGTSVLAIKARPVILVDRFVEMASHEPGEYEPDSGRIDQMIEAWRAISNHPVIGIGVESTAADLERLPVHNTILRLWAGIGICGLVFICWVYAIAFLEALTNFRKAKRMKSYQFTRLSFVVLVALIGWFFVDMVQPQFYDRFKFVILILLFSLSKVIKAAGAVSPTTRTALPVYAE